VSNSEKETLIKELEQKLDSFNSDERKEALLKLCEKVEAGEIILPEPGSNVNLHCHTFFSYNCYGYSPGKFAWLARKKGLAVAGIVDFDVLDGLEEFLGAAKLLGLKACVGMETRVFIPEFAEKEINSPGEPGISYHMGVGFSEQSLEGEAQDFLAGLKETAQKRNRAVMERVNKYLSPVELDYEKDVLVLTPNSNPTERHLSLAYGLKANEIFAYQSQLKNFWRQKLSINVDEFEFPQGVELLNQIRAKTMKQGEPGYAKPAKGDFPTMADTNRFILEAGGIPTHTWLNGLSYGEQEIEGLLEIAMQSGVAALNIIPDRNYTPDVKDKKLENLYQVVELAQKLHLPIVVGTEMNSPGQKFVDDFNSQELLPLAPVFLRGAHIVYAHSVLQRAGGLGYTSEWAKKNFESIAEKNEFFRKLGCLLEPSREELLNNIPQEPTPKQILDILDN